MQTSMLKKKPSCFQEINSWKIQTPMNSNSGKYSAPYKNTHPSCIINAKKPPTIHFNDTMYRYGIKLQEKEN